MGKNGLEMGVWLSFYKFAENREFFQGGFLPYKLGIETPVLKVKFSNKKMIPAMILRRLSKNQSICQIP